MTNPFAELGLDPAAALSNDDVRATWRRIAEATHPDRADGGDPERFARAAAAYTELRTTFGRGEARAALAESAGPTRIAARPIRVAAGVARLLPGWARKRRPRARGGRPVSRAGWLIAGRHVRLALRIVLAAAASAAAVLAAGPGPAGPALVTGAATWLLLTARRDLGPR